MDTVQLVTKKALGNAAPRPDVIARTNDNIVYRRPGVRCCWTIDTKGMPPAVRAELKRLGGFWPALKTVLPALGNLARWSGARPAAACRAPIPGPRSQARMAFTSTSSVKEGGDAERFLKTLHERCWLAGLGWLMVGASGTLLERSIVDRMVGQPGRPVFEGGPVLEPPLVQDKAKRRPVAVEGGCSTPWRRAGRCRSSSGRGSKTSRPQRSRALAPEEAKAARALHHGKSQRAGLAHRHVGERRTGRHHAPARRRVAAGYRAAVRRPGAGRLHRRRCAGGPGSLRGRDHGGPAGRCRIMAVAAPRSCAGPTARRGSIRSPTAARSTS